MPGYKMLFNTGVRIYTLTNPLYKPDKWDEIINGILHKIYYLENKPPNNWVLLHLSNNNTYPSIKIIDGGMCSKYANFFIKKEIKK